MTTTMRNTDHRLTLWMLAAIATLAVGIDRAHAQTSTAGALEGDAWTALSPTDLETLVGPLALYPDDLIAVLLPASTFPLQVVQAARFLEAREADPSLEPDAGWDESIVALLNYPEALALLNDDLDWTYELGEAVVYQQGDVLNAVQSFRERAQAAGNLATDDRQVVAVEDDGAITIAPTDPEVIYVPYYDPARVVVHQPAPVYHYYPYGYPVYYYPYPFGYSFRAGLFWGVTSAFLVSWHDHYLHVRHHSHFGHPYYGYAYYNPWYARSSVYINVNYVGSSYRWRPSYHHSGRPSHYAGFARLRDRHFVRTPSERHVRSGWRRDGGGGAGFRAPRRDAIPATADQRRTPRSGTGRAAVDDLHVRNPGARPRDDNRRVRELGGSGGRVAMGERTVTPNRGSSTAGNRDARIARALPRTGADRAATPTRAQNNGRRAQGRDLDPGNAAGRVARNPRVDSQPRAPGRVAPQTRAQPNDMRARSGINREQPMSPPQARSSGRSINPGAYGRDNDRRTQGRGIEPGNAAGRVARNPRVDSQPRALGRPSPPSGGTLGRVAPQTRAQPNDMRARSGINREQPMSPPQARPSGRSVNPGAYGRADVGRDRGAAVRSGGRAQPGNAGGRSGGGRFGTSNRSGQKR